MPTRIEWCEEINHNLIQRFWSYVDKTNHCWKWNAGLFPNGYGQFRVGNNKVKAHRFSWIINGGFIPKGYCILHKCDNPKCVNPNHLFLGTHKDNSVDRERKKRGAYNLKPQFGEKNGSSKLKGKTVITIRYLHRYFGYSFSALSIRFEISKSQIANIIHRRSWRHI